MKTGALLLFDQGQLFVSAQIWVRSRNLRLALLVWSCSTEVYSVAITTFLTIVPQEAILADTFFFYQVVDYSINSIPASLLLNLAGSTQVAHYHYAALRALTQAGSN